MPAQFSFCYQLYVPSGTDTFGKTLVFTDVTSNTTVNMQMEDINQYLLGEYQPDGGVTYYICSRTEPYLMVYGSQSDFTQYGLTLTGGFSPCSSNGDCYPGNGGGNATTAYCYQISINTAITELNRVEFSYTPYGNDSFTTIVLASNWQEATNPTQSSVILYVCSSTQPAILVDGEAIFNLAEFGISRGGGTVSCQLDGDCMPTTDPIDCVLSDWGYGATQDSFIVGTWSPCQLLNGSYQESQYRYVITPASGGGTCIGETIRYRGCTPTQSGTIPSVSIPTFSGTTANSVTATTTITNTGGSTVTAAIFTIYQDEVEISSNTLTDFTFGISVQFTGLLPNTQYTLGVRALNSTGYSMPAVGTFTTTGSSGITTPSVSNLTQVSARLSSTFTNSSGDPFVRYGVIYKLGNSTNLIVGGQGVVQVETGQLAPDISPAALISDLTGLLASNSYYAKAYVQSADGITYVYSPAVNFNTIGIPQEQSSAQLALSSIALAGSAGTDSTYDFITATAASLTRSYVSVIIETGDDPEPGVYQLSAVLQQAKLDSLRWVLETKISPSDQNWKLVNEVLVETDLNTIQPPPGWTYYTYSADRLQAYFRPMVPGYYRFTLRGLYLNNTAFSVNEEVVIGRPTEDIDLAYSTLRQGISSIIQVTASPTFPEWIPEFSEDFLYGINVTQTGSTIVPSININNSTRSFSSIWGINLSNTKIEPILNVVYSSPFKDLTKSNTFSKDFPITVLAPFPIISFSTPSIFTAPITAGSTVTIGVSTQYANNYVISSTLGTGSTNAPVSYTNLAAGSYTITATATNDSGPTLQTSTINSTLTVEAASPILAQVPQQICGRNLFIDINTLPYVNLNGSTFNNIAIVSQPTHGVLTSSGYTLRYIPNEDYTGTDIFSIRVRGLNSVISNTVNVGVLVSAPSFTVGISNGPIVFNSTEVGSSRDLIIPITNTSANVKLEVHSIRIDQDLDEFGIVVGSGQNEVLVNSIEDVDILPGNSYNITLRVNPQGIGVRSSKLKIDHN